MPSSNPILGHVLPGILFISYGICCILHSISSETYWKWTKTRTMSKEETRKTQTTPSPSSLLSSSSSSLSSPSSSSLFCPFPPPPLFSLFLSRFSHLILRILVIFLCWIHFMVELTQWDHANKTMESLFSSTSSIEHMMLLVIVIGTFVCFLFCGHNPRHPSSSPLHSQYLYSFLPSCSLSLTLLFFALGMFMNGHVGNGEIPPDPMGEIGGNGNGNSTMGMTRTMGRGGGAMNMNMSIGMMHHEFMSTLCILLGIISGMLLITMRISNIDEETMMDNVIGMIQGEGKQQEGGILSPSHSSQNIHTEDVNERKHTNSISGTPLDHHNGNGPISTPFPSPSPSPHRPLHYFSATDYRLLSLIFFLRNLQSLFVLTVGTFFIHIAIIVSNENSPFSFYTNGELRHWLWDSEMGESSPIRYNGQLVEGKAHAIFTHSHMMISVVGYFIFWGGVCQLMEMGGTKYFILSKGANTSNSINTNTNTRTRTRPVNHVNGRVMEGFKVRWTTFSTYLRHIFPRKYQKLSNQIPLDHQKENQGEKKGRDNHNDIDMDMVTLHENQNQNEIPTPISRAPLQEEKSEEKSPMIDRFHHVSLQ